MATHCIQDGQYISGESTTPRVWAELGRDWAQVGAGVLVPSFGGQPGLAALSDTRVVRATSTGGPALQAYDFIAGVFTPVGNALALAGNMDVAALSASRIALTNATTNTLQTYDFDGTDWTTVGNALSPVGGVGVSAVAALSATRVAFIDSGSDELRAYDFDGTDWAQVGNGLSLATVEPDIVGLTGSRISLLNPGNQRIQTYDFDGTDWAPVGNAFAAPLGLPGGARISDSEIAVLQKTTDALSRYRFDGTDWAEFGTPLSLGVVGNAALTPLSSTLFAALDSATLELRAYTTAVTLPADFEIEFCWQRRDNGAATETRVLAGMGADTLVVIRDTTGGPPPNLVLFRINSVFLSFPASEATMGAVLQNQYVKLRFRRVSDALSLWINGVFIETLTSANVPGVVAVASMGQENVTAGLDSILADLKITDLTFGSMWEYTNRDDVGAQLADSGPAANHGRWFLAADPMTDEEADARRVTITVDPEGPFEFPTAGPQNFTRDVFLFNTDDGGEINITGGIVEQGHDLQTMAYLALFGGNYDDSGVPDDPLSWWGNIGESVQYRSRTQYIMTRLPLTSSSLRDLERAAERDLAVFVENGIADSVSANATVSGLNTVALTATITADGDTQTVQFTELWQNEFRNPNN